MQIKLSKRTDGAARELKKLLAVIARLRGEDGCPWDRAQTHQTLARYLLEEAHEAYDMLGSDAPDNEVADELGDVLLQVVLHARLASERGAYDFAAICRRIRYKMITRHPHVFGEKPLTTPEEVEKSWEARKTSKRPGGRLSGIPRTLPALLRAERVQDRASAVGFDWEDTGGVVDKIHEEAGELAEALRTGADLEIENEMGDLLFSLVNLARYLAVSPEQALNRTTDKFIRRFTFMEERVHKAGKKLSDYNLAELDAIWDEAKANELKQ
jgi:tetrapyrrole methylase family protein / MazG family protein